MSVVACRVYEDRIEIAADSITVRGHTQTKGQTTKFAKLEQINGMTIGSVGACEESSLFYQYCETRKPAGYAERDIRSFLVEFAEWKKKQTEEWKLDNDYILIFGSKAFITENFMVEEIKTYEAIGAGFAYALTSLFLGHTVVESVNVACELSIHCEKPIVHFVISRI